MDKLKPHFQYNEYPDEPNGEITDGTGYVYAFVPLHRQSSRYADRQKIGPRIVAALTEYAALKQSHEELVKALEEADRLLSLCEFSEQSDLDAVDSIAFALAHAKEVKP